MFVIKDTMLSFILLVVVVLVTGLFAHRTGTDN